MHSFIHNTEDKRTETNYFLIRQCAIWKKPLNSQMSNSLHSHTRYHTHCLHCGISRQLHCYWPLLRSLTNTPGFTLIKMTSHSLLHQRLSLPAGQEQRRVTRSSRRDTSQRCPCGGSDVSTLARWDKPVSGSGLLIRAELQTCTPAARQERFKCLELGARYLLSHPESLGIKATFSKHINHFPVEKCSWEQKSLIFSLTSASVNSGPGSTCFSVCSTFIYLILPFCHFTAVASILFVNVTVCPGRSALWTGFSYLNWGSEDGGCKALSDSFVVLVHINKLDCSDETDTWWN